jgi:hypothetical protein
MNNKIAKRLRKIAKLATHAEGKPMAPGHGSWTHLEHRNDGSLRHAEMSGRNYYQKLKKEYLRSLRS